MDTKDQVSKEAAFVIDAYRYALDNNLDIKNKEDVEKIVKALRPEESSQKDIELLMPMLEIFDRITKAELARMSKIN